MSDSLDLIDKLANEIAEDAVQSDKTMDAKRDAFKLLLPYYTLLFKARKPPDDSDGLTFNALGAALQADKEASNGGNGTTVYARTRGYRNRHSEPPADED